MIILLVIVLLLLFCQNRRKRYSRQRKWPRRDWFFFLSGCTRFNITQHNKLLHIEFFHSARTVRPGFVVRADNDRTRYASFSVEGRIGQCRGYIPGDITATWLRAQGRVVFTIPGTLLATSRETSNSTSSYAFVQIPCCDQPAYLVTDHLAISPAVRARQARENSGGEGAIN